jgi:putative transposase
VLQRPRSVYEYKSRKDEQAALRMRIKDIAQARVSYGYRRIHVLLLREGWKVNHKRVYRLYKLEGLMMRPKRPRRHVSACRRMIRATATHPNESWSMDFMSDALYDGQKIKLLTIVDNFTRESLAIEVAWRLGGHGVVAVLMDVAKKKGLPKSIRIDNGPEFTAKAIRKWLERLGVKTLFIEPGSPWENGYIESFNGKLRDELLNLGIFMTLEEAKVLIEQWRREYNQIRPHSARNYLPPAPEAILSVIVT